MDQWISFDHKIPIQNKSKQLTATLTGKIC